MNSINEYINEYIENNKVINTAINVYYFIEDFYNVVMDIYYEQNKAEFETWGDFN